MSDLDHVSLCSGILGLDRAAQAVFGGRLVAVSDIKAAAVAWLARNLPDVPNVGDLTTYDWTPGMAEIVTSGWPCQPHSAAGLRLGEDDPRAIWPAVAETIATIRPAVWIGENVPRVATNGELRRVVRSLAELGYVGAWGVWSAADVGAAHLRRRLCVVAVDPAAAPWLLDGSAVGAYARGPAADADGAELRDEPGRCGGPDGPGPGIAGHDGADGEAGRADGGRPGRPGRRGPAGGRGPGLAAHPDAAGCGGGAVAEDPDGGPRDGGAVPDTEGVGRAQGRAEHERELGGPDVAERGPAPAGGPPGGSAVEGGRLFPTPRVADHRRGAVLAERQRNGRVRGPGEADLPTVAVTLLPTPIVSDGLGGRWTAPDEGPRPGRPLREIVDLLPTPTARDHKGPGLRAGGRPDGYARSAAQLDLPGAAALLPTPMARDSSGRTRDGQGSPGLPDVAVTLFKTPLTNLATNGGSQHPDKRKAGGHGPTLADEVEHLLPTPTVADTRNTRNATANRSAANVHHKPGWTLCDVAHADRWGAYAVAVARWEAVTGVVAPDATVISSRNGKPVLSPLFVEWLMGFPAGWVTSAGSRSEQLSMLGDAVVARQLEHAIRSLLPRVAARLLAELAAA